jgi:hypothetical protein
VSYGSGPRLPAKVGSDTATCLAASYGPRALSIKKNLAFLPVQLGTYALNARAHVSKVPNVRAIMDLQDMRVGSVVNAYKAYKQTATV